MVSGNSGDTEIKVKEAGNLLRRAEIADSEYACKLNECTQRASSSSSKTYIYNPNPLLSLSTYLCSGRRKSISKQ